MADVFVVFAGFRAAETATAAILSGGVYGTGAFVGGAAVVATILFVQVYFSLTDPERIW